VDVIEGKKFFSVIGHELGVIVNKRKVKTNGGLAC
jgi:hypothetical protein